MLLGKGVKPLGEQKSEAQTYQKHIAGTVGYLLNVPSYSSKMLPVYYFNTVYN
jgi:hypothetical protein